MSFPKNDTIRKQWIDFCRRKDDINPDISSICAAHFTPADFVKNLQYEMGFYKRYVYRLKPEAVPTINPQCKVHRSLSGVKVHSTTRPRTTSCIKQSDAKSLDGAIDSEVNNDEIERLKLEIKNLKQKNSTLEEKQKNSKLQIRSLEMELKKSEFDRLIMGRKLQQIFTDDQESRLKRGLERCEWSKADIAKSIRKNSTKANNNKLLGSRNFNSMQ